MKYIKTNHIVIAMSTLMLAMLSSTLIFWYVNTVRPELIDSKEIKMKNEAKIEEINDSVEKFASNSADIGRFVVESEVKSIEKLPKTLGEANIGKVPENPIKTFFKLVQTKADDLLLVKGEANKIFSDSLVEPRKPIEPIKFPSELGKSKTLLKELNTEHSNKLMESSTKVVKSQVGLSLRTEKIFSAVYRIQNLFGTPGKVGHLFVSVGRDGIDHRYNLDDCKINFGSEKELINSFGGKLTTSKSELSDYVVHIFKNNDKIENVEDALIPISKDIQYINPYLWLIETTKIIPTIDTNDITIGLLYLKDKALPIHYPTDVKLFDLNAILLSDTALHSGGLKRILNHGRDYLVIDDLKL